VRGHSVVPHQRAERTSYKETTIAQYATFTLFKVDRVRWQIPVNDASAPAMEVEPFLTDCQSASKRTPIGVQKGPPSSSSVTGMTGALFALVAA
jgi:hypothetical protein